MKVFLLHPERDAAIKPELRDRIFEAMLSGRPFAVENVEKQLARERAKHPDWHGDAETPDDLVTQDLELTTLWQAMAAGDAFLFETVRRTMLSSVRDPGQIEYRQQVLADCLEHRDVVRGLYGLSLDAVECERQVGSLWTRANPDRILGRSVQILSLYLAVLKRLRQAADEHAATFRSPGFQRFFAMVREELSDEYLETFERHLAELKFGSGVLETARLGKGQKGRDYVVRVQRQLSWKERLLPGSRPDAFSFTIPPRDEAGFQALERLRGQGLNVVANAVAQSADHVKSFFSMLRFELAFYLGCLNLHERLEERGGEVCFPTPVPSEEVALSAELLQDVALAFHLDRQVVANDVDADGRRLLVVTGANQGGKSTFLRSLGLAQLMMQCGMFVGARSFRASVCSGVFTHYKREEDAEMEGGKLDEELKRMSDVVDAIEPGALLLCNESFASTNEREGSEIARKVVHAMLDNRIRVVLVTHMFDLGSGFQREQREDALFLRAERGEGGRRTFRVVEGEPRPTSHGEDSFRRIFGVDEPPAAAASA